MEAEALPVYLNVSIVFGTLSLLLQVGYFLVSCLLIFFSEVIVLMELKLRFTFFLSTPAMMARSLLVLFTKRLMIDWRLQ